MSSFRFVTIFGLLNMSYLFVQGLTQSTHASLRTIHTLQVFSNLKRNLPRRTNSPAYTDSRMHSNVLSNHTSYICLILRYSDDFENSARKLLVFWRNKSYRHLSDFSFKINKPLRSKRRCLIGHTRHRLPRVVKDHSSTSIFLDMTILFLAEDVLCLATELRLGMVLL